MPSKFSKKTIARFARFLADVIYHSEFTLLFVEYSAAEFDNGGNTQVRALHLIQGIQELNSVSSLSASSGLSS